MIRRQDELIELATKYSNMPEETLLFMLGVDVYYENNPDLKRRGIKASAPYLKIGQQFFSDRLPVLQDLLCDRKTGRPKSKIVESDWVGVAGALLGDLTFGAAAAILAILMKNGIIWFCKLDFLKDIKPERKKSSKKPKKKLKT